MNFGCVLRSFRKVEWKCAFSPLLNLRLLYLICGFLKEIITECHNSKFCYCIYWKLNDDPNRPSKRSKAIRIKFHKQRIEDYLNCDARNKKISEERFKQKVQMKFKNFNPNHNEKMPLDDDRDIENWVVC